MGTVIPVPRTRNEILSDIEIITKKNYFYEIRKMKIGRLKLLISNQKWKHSSFKKSLLGVQLMTRQKF